jgi:hypothetical protein
MRSPSVTSWGVPIIVTVEKKLKALLGGIGLLRNDVPVVLNVVCQPVRRNGSKAGS